MVSGMQEGEWIPVAEAAARCRVSLATVFSWVREDAVASRLTPERHRLVHWTALAQELRHLPDIQPSVEVRNADSNE